MPLRLRLRGLRPARHDAIIPPAAALAAALATSALATSATALHAISAPVATRRVGVRFRLLGVRVRFRGLGVGVRFTALAAAIAAAQDAASALSLAVSSRSRPSADPRDVFQHMPRIP